MSVVLFLIVVLLAVAAVATEYRFAAGCAGGAVVLALLSVLGVVPA